MFISNALAQSIGGIGGGLTQDPTVSFLIPLVLIFVVFYFLMMRPQTKKLKADREMRAALRRGDRVLTQGGIVGTVARIPEGDELQIEVAKGVQVTMLRSAIQAVLSKGEPVANDTKTNDDK